MGAYGVVVEKEGTFRGAPERFSNSYHYRITAPTEADYQLLADAVVAAERVFYPSSISYKTVRVFGPTDGAPSANLIRLVQDLTGTGSDTRSGADTYPELCYCISLPAGRSETTQRRIYTRKYIRIIKMVDAGSSAVTGSLTATAQSDAEAWYESMIEVGSPVSFNLVTPRDQAVDTGASAHCLPFARIRQMKQ